MEDEKVYFNEYCFARAVLRWLVSIKVLTPLEAKEIDRLNRLGFNIGKDELKKLDGWIEFW